MNLHQMHDLRTWHLRHGIEHPVERQIWEAVLTLWLLGWSSLPALVLADAAWLLVGCLGLIALPRAYVATRARLHRRGHLRCDWLLLLR